MDNINNNTNNFNFDPNKLEESLRELGQEIENEDYKDGLITEEIPDTTVSRNIENIHYDNPVYQREANNNTNINRENKVVQQPLESVSQPIQQTVSNEEPVVNNSVPKMNPKEFMDNIKFNLDSIVMVESSPLEEIENFSFIMNNKSKTQIVANQSNYIAYMEPLNYDEISALTNSTLSEYASEVLLTQTVHKKINTTSLGKLSYEEWLNLTSYYDLDSFMYGIYLQTFPGDTKFNITCGHCKENVEVLVNNDTIINGKDVQSTANVQKILSSTNPKQLLDESLINVTKKVLLEDSKIVVTLKLPTLKKHLNMMGSVKPEVKDKTSHILALMIFIDEMLMMDVKRSMETNKPCYYKIEDKGKIANTIAQMTIKDAKKLSNEIEKIIDQNMIEFKIKSFECPHCKQQLGDIKVDMNSLLFYQILQL